MHSTFRIKPCPAFFALLLFSTAVATYALPADANRRDFGRDLRLAPPSPIHHHSASPSHHRIDTDRAQQHAQQHTYAQSSYEHGFPQQPDEYHPQEEENTNTFHNLYYPDHPELHDDVPLPIFQRQMHEYLKQQKTMQRGSLAPSTSSTVQLDVHQRPLSSSAASAPSSSSSLSSPPEWPLFTSGRRRGRYSKDGLFGLMHGPTSAEGRVFHIPPIWLLDFKENSAKHRKTRTLEQQQENNFRSRNSDLRSRLKSLITKRKGITEKGELNAALSFVLQQGQFAAIYFDQSDHWKDFLERHPHLIGGEYHTNQYDAEFIAIIDAYNPQGC
jgi:hypothetical protein